MSLPVLTPEMRAVALEKAAAARRERSAALAEVKKGALPVATVLAGEDPRLQRAKVRQVLLAVPGIGAVKADRLLKDAGVDPSRRVAGLGANQRKALADLLAA